MRLRDVSSHKRSRSGSGDAKFEADRKNYDFILRMLLSSTIERYFLQFNYLISLDLMHSVNSVKTFESKKNP